MRYCLVFIEFFIGFIYFFLCILFLGGFLIMVCKIWGFFIIFLCIILFWLLMMLVFVVVCVYVL